MTVEIQSMYALMPLKVEYKQGEQTLTAIIFADMANETFHWSNAENNTNLELEEAITKIIHEKKEAARTPALPDAVIDKAKKIFEEEHA